MFRLLFDALKKKAELAELSTHVQNCEEGCSVGFEIAYCDTAKELAKPAALAAFAAAAEVFSGKSDAVNPLARKR